MAESQGGALAATRVLDVALHSLRGDGLTEATIKNAYEAVALVGHACMLAVGFRLVGLGEDHRMENNTDPTVLPKEWNAQSTYAFRYAHSQSAMEYLLKLNRLGNNAVVFALALGHDKTTSFDLPVKDYISESALPLTLTSDSASTLRDVFISTSRLDDLISLFKINVIQKLAPGLYKEGYEDTTGQEPQIRRPEEPSRRDPLRDDRYLEPARPYPFDDPLAAPPRRPAPPGDFAPPGFEDEYEINRPPRGYQPQPGRGRNPLTIGDRDLYPPGLGPRDPLRGTIGPGGGGGTGMHPTFDDPIFGGQRGGEYNPQIPPGSRYDPVGPGDGPPFGRNRGPHGRGFGPGGFGGGFGGDII
ncbi:hypothetical protein VTN96DRAFT_2244 [Rasamsonia emersonii]